MPAITKILPYLRCPETHSDLKLSEQTVNSDKHRYPFLDDLLLLTPQWESFLAQWQGRAFAVLNFLEKRASEAKRESQINALYESTKARLKIMARAYQENAIALQELLKPMETALESVHEVRVATAERISTKVTLDGYYDNIFRDWSWENGENEAAMDLVAKTVSGDFSPGVCVHLGAGSGRLVADFHKQYKPDLSIAIDFNPFLALFGRSMIAGGKKSFFEFPHPAIDLHSAAVKRECMSPYGQQEDIHFIIADAMSPPLRSKSVDTVVTSWFVDIIPQPFGQTCKQVNRILKEGGTWINYGPLGFSGRPAQCFSKEELREMAEANFFSVDGWQFDQVPYLQSPASCHGRNEKVLCFFANKTKSVDDPEDFHQWPEWIENFNQPIPVLPQFIELKVKSNVYYDILDAINGERSVNDIVQLMTKVYKMDEKIALESLTTFLSNVWDGKLASQI